MDPTTDEQLDYGDEEYGGNHKMQYHGAGGTIPALAEDEMMGEDDEYDDLYNDVNVGEGFLQLQQRSEGPVPSVDAGNGSFQAQKTSFPDARGDGITGSEVAKIPGVATDGKYTGTEIRFSEQKGGPVAERGTERPADIAQKGMPSSAMTMTHDSLVVNPGYQGGSMPMPQKTGPGPINMPERNVNEVTPLVNSGVGGSRVVPPHMPTNQLSSSGNVNVNSQIISETPPIRPSLENNGNTMLFVGELHWWTTDAELESVLTQYGKIKEIKFFDERASGKSKGYCQVEFFDSASAAACKEGMNGHIFNGRACVVAFATPQTIKQMGSSYVNKTQNQVQQSQPQQGRRPMNEGGVGRGGANYNTPGGDAGGRNFGRGNWGRGGPGMPNRGPGGGGPVRGRGGAMGSKNNMMGNPGVGAGAGGAFGQGLGGPAFGGPPAGLMHHQGMMGPGFDPGFMGRGAGYGGFSGPAFPGMIPPFPGVNPMGLPGVAPHVNPAFFGRGMAANGMGMMGAAGMDGPHPGMWADTSGGGWGGGEEHGRRTRESSYGGEDNASEYGGYAGEVSHDKGTARSSAVSREKERGSERDWSGNSERKHRDEREHDRERYDSREHRHRENERDGYREHRHKERESEYEDDYDRGQSSSRSRSRSRAVQEEDHRSSRSRDANYGKRRRAPSE